MQHGVHSVRTVQEGRTVREIWIFTLKRGMLMLSSEVFRVTCEEVTEEDSKQQWRK